MLPKSGDVETGHQNGDLKMRIIGLFVIALFFAASGTVQAENRVLVMGDSFMTSNGSNQASVPHVLAKLTGAKVRSQAVTGARYHYSLPLTGAMGMNITKQFRQGNWDWIVINGGGNDLWMGCGCTRCQNRLERLISSDGMRGSIPGLVSRARQTGAKVIYVGYLRSPGMGSPIENCKSIGDALETRISRLAQVDQGITFVSLADMVPHSDRSFHALDMIHPSPKGSAAAAQRIAQIMQGVNG
jgi:lysophospholipase L1-like esterase